MKRIVALMAICVSLLFTGCSNYSARQEYNAVEKIAQMEDHYTKVRSVFNSVEGGYSLNVSKFEGRETLWTGILEKGKEIQIDFSFALSSGKAKVVHIDDAGNVTTIIECSPETATNGYISKTVSLKSGENRLKIVGFACEDIDLKMLSSDF